MFPMINSSKCEKVYNNKTDHDRKERMNQSETTQPFIQKISRERMKDRFILLNKRLFRTHFICLTHKANCTNRCTKIYYKFIHRTFCTNN